ncbi:MAG: S-layer homology domain-containing protein [Anaerolineales bacterium]|nr:S-layer homology domain-containing protein [Anaerolineales bacterium]
MPGIEHSRLKVSPVAVVVRNYCPRSAVTRAQMAIFLFESQIWIIYSSQCIWVFTDVPVNYWSDKWIEQLAVEGVTSGCGNGNYCPDDSVTRAQMAVFLVKAFNLP